jgi:hypothetical protein
MPYLFSTFSQTGGQAVAPLLDDLARLLVEAEEDLPSAANL